MYTSIYKPERQYNFIIRQAMLYQQRWYIAAAAVFGVMLLVSLIKAYFDPQELNELTGMYVFVFYIGGFILSSQAFMELHTPNQAYAFLTLPVSTLEKLVGSWLLTSPVYIIAYTAATYLIYVLSTLLTGFEVSPIVSLDIIPYLEIIGTYMVLQTIFLWGACYFRKNNFLKTILSLIVLFIVLGAYTGGLGWLLFQQYEGSFSLPADTKKHLEHLGKDVLAPTIEFLFWAVLGPYMLLTAYFTLKERQL